MRALVVYESMFGNTRQVAEAAAAALAAAGKDVTLTDVGAAPTELSDVDLLVVGGPTHAFGMTRAGTRADAVEQGAPAAAQEVGIREWLDLLVAPERTVRCAAFDTRVRPPRLPGSAARAADRRLRHLGLLVVAPAVSFWVTGTKGRCARASWDACASGRRGWSAKRRSPVADVPTASGVASCGCGAY